MFASGDTHTTNIRVFNWENLFVNSQWENSDAQSWWVQNTANGWNSGRDVQKNWTRFGFCIRLHSFHSSTSQCWLFTFTTCRPHCFSVNKKGFSFKKTRAVIYSTLLWILGRGLSTSSFKVIAFSFSLPRAVLRKVRRAQRRRLLTDNSGVKSCNTQNCYTALKFRDLAVPFLGTSKVTILYLFIWIILFIGSLETTLNSQASSVTKELCSKS